MSLNRLSWRRGLRLRRAFTLAELLISISILAILSSAALFAMFGVMEDAKAARTRSQIARLHEMLVYRWDAYQSRAVPIQLPVGISPKVAAQRRLAGVRELMRMELPDRKSDVVDTAAVLARRHPLTGVTAPLEVSLWRTYRRRAEARLGPTWATDWSQQHQGAECLYLIVSSIHDGDNNGLDFFRESEVGDVDGDGMPEILDAWENPIEFLRWAPGFLTNSDIQVADAVKSPDTFDLLMVDPRWGHSNPMYHPYALYPLVFSAGRDGVYDIATEMAGTLRYRMPPTAPSGYPTNFPNDPQTWWDDGGTPRQLGMSVDVAGDGNFDDADNLTNHLLGLN